MPYDREFKEYLLIFLRFAYFPANFSQALFQNINDSSLVCWIIQGILGYLKNIATAEHVREDSRCEQSASLKERNKLHIALETPALSGATDIRTLCAHVYHLFGREIWKRRRGFEVVLFAVHGSWSYQRLLALWWSLFLHWICSRIIRIIGQRSRFLALFLFSFDEYFRYESVCSPNLSYG